MNPEQALDYLGTISLLTTRFGGKRVEGTQQAAGRQFYGAASGAGTGGVIEQSGGVRIQPGGVNYNIKVDTPARSAYLGATNHLRATGALDG